MSALGHGIARIPQLAALLGAVAYNYGAPAARYALAKLPYVLANTAVYRGSHDAYNYVTSSHKPYTRMPYGRSYGGYRRPFRRTFRRTFKRRSFRGRGRRAYGGKFRRRRTGYRRYARPGMRQRRYVRAYQRGAFGRTPYNAMAFRFRRSLRQSLF